MRKPGAGAAKGEGGSAPPITVANWIRFLLNQLEYRMVQPIWLTLGLPHRGSLLRAKSLHFGVCVGGPPKNHWGVILVIQVCKQSRVWSIWITYSLLVVLFAGTWYNHHSSHFLQAGGRDPYYSAWVSGEKLSEFGFLYELPPRRNGAHRYDRKQWIRVHMYFVHSLYKCTLSRYKVSLLPGLTKVSLWIWGEKIQQNTEKILLSLIDSFKRVWEKEIFYKKTKFATQKFSFCPICLWKN